MSDLLDKIAKLLTQAERSDNENERDAFLVRAQALSTAAQIDLEVARQHQSNQEKREEPVQERIYFGEKAGKKGLHFYVLLFGTIAVNNNLKYNIAHNNTSVYAFGFPSDIEMAKALFQSILAQMIEESNRYLAKGEYKNETHQVDKYVSEYDWWEGKNVRRWVGSEIKPVDGRIARASFQRAFINTIGNRLHKARRDAIKESEVTDTGLSEEVTSSSTSTGAELVLAHRDLAVSDYYKKASTAKGSWKGGSNKGHSSYASQAGREAGQRARLTPQKGISA